MTRIEQIWEKLEATTETSPLVMRGYGVEGHSQIYATWNTRGKERGLAVNMSSEYRLSFQKRHEFRDVNVSQYVPPGQGSHFYLLIELKNQHYKDIFTSLAEDLIRSVASIKEEAGLAKALLNRLLQWEALFSKITDQGLTPQAQRGLYGELYFLDILLQSGLPFIECVNSWTGPLATVQDFQRGKKAVEVKTSSGNDHQKIQISSNRQLDETELESLYLVHVSLDVRPNEKATLNALVAVVEAELSTDMNALYLFQKRLEAGGYFKSHASFYEETGYILRAQNSYRVEGDFPRITERSTPEGVGDVRYSIIPAQCVSWSVNLENLLSDFKTAL